ncbi:DNA polymerase III subunit alpha [Macrococcus armenti]|uniref:DNA polymerase III subunit alpha n=1 Tax=Macrococcus armenti TaxID=2875764 RepID=UPI001CCCA637|nr:DNA polymerase III subunit alpha [Macrococcus armenti]UBH07938.1 DNA polymerase III subunit alpha [Macrococcus armenti]UBH10170.1 DNA polymerase III subunit alpha [Macrococcus armenti]
MVVHLNVHSAYDLLHSTVEIDALVQRVKKEQQSAVAITDFNVLFGVQSFYKACVRNEIKPIIGMEISVTDGLHEVRAVCLAKDNTGLLNLFKLSSRIQLKGAVHTPLNWLKQYETGMIFIFKAVQEGQQHFVEAVQDVYVCHESIKCGKQVYIADVLYLNAEDIQHLEVLNAIEENRKLPLETLRIQAGTANFKEEAQILDIGVDPTLIAATHEIASRCNVDLSSLRATMPKYPIDNMTSDEYLLELLQQKKTQLPHFDETYEKRLRYEYEVIKNMGYSDYFLIVGDLIQYAKSNGILVGPGRGSSSGSLISYVLGITEVDPIQYNLLFERFLNPDRVTMPDIDIDFEDTKRDQVIQYVVDKYGGYNVSGIVTFGHLNARAVMRDTGRILQFSEDDLKAVSALIPKRVGITLDDVMENEQFMSFIEADERRRKWFEIAYALEGLPRNTSTHAAGVIIHDQLLTDYVPLIQGDGTILTQWTMTEVEAIGLLKIDFLGLKNLSIIHNVQNQVAAQFNQQVNLNDIPLDDEKVYALLSEGDTTGIFQLESDGIRNVLKRLKPNNFNDIVAVLALYRPGPMEQIPVYIDRRHGNMTVEYIHDDLAFILKDTYGVIIYQEQIMQIANQFAGFSYGEADILRRAMSKKDMSVLLTEKSHFIEGSIRNGYDAQTAEAIYDLILKFANYGFPKAHAVAYAKIAYWMMYLKVHYSNIFYAAILSNQIGSELKTKEIIDEVKKRSIPIYPSDINKAHWYYRTYKDGILNSLGMIKGIGYKSVQEIIEVRKQGPFKDIYDFCARIPSRIATKVLMESLIHAGSFDSFGHTRATLLATLDMVLDVERAGDGEDSFLQSLGLSKKKDYIIHEEMSDMKKAEYEKEVLGFYLTHHPVETKFNSLQYLPLFKVAQQLDHHYMLIFIDGVRRIRTKKGQPMAFISGFDGMDVIDIVCFPEVFKKYESLIQDHAMIVVKGKFDKRNGKENYIADTILEIEAFKAFIFEHAQHVYIRKPLKDNMLLDGGPISVIHFNGTQSILGTVSKEMMHTFVENYNPEDIRII